MDGFQKRGHHRRGFDRKPEEDGYSLIRTLRQLPPERGGQIPAIALTAFAREEDRIRALSAGFHMHLSKPVEPKQLVEAVAYLARVPDARDEQTQSLQRMAAVK